MQSIDWAAKHLALVLTSLFIVLAVLNLIVVIRSRSTNSLIGGPIGGVAGTVGFLLMPECRALAWLPWLLDLSSLKFIVFGTVPFAKSIWARSFFNLSAEYCARTGPRVVKLSLYRGGQCVLAESFKTRRGKVSTSLSGKWRIDGEDLLVRLGGAEVRFLLAKTAGGSQLECVESSLEGEMVIV
jgi:hypothetical protein